MRYKRADESYKVAVVEFGKSAGHSLGVYAYTEQELGIPTVGFGNFLDLLEHMQPEQAEQLAHALLHAAKVARGETSRCGAGSRD